MSRPSASNSRSTPSRTFPIRTSQSQRRMNPSASYPYALPSDYHLRRKTPNGTIDAAYDGSFQPPIPRGPPPKQMILPSSENSAHLSLSDSGWQQRRPPKVQGLEQPIAADNHGFAFLQQPLNNGFWHQSAALQLPSGVMSHHPAIFNNPPAPFFNSYQPIIRANEHNMRAFCPPPLPSSETLPFGQGAWQPDYPGWDNTYAGHNASTYQPLVFPDVTGYWPQRMAHQDLPAMNSQISHTPFESGLLPPNLESLSLEPMGAKSSDPVYRPQPRFKEKALLGAHEAYVDLLAHADMMRRGQSGKVNTDGSQLSSRHMLFPKPPNPIPFFQGSAAGITANGSIGAGYSKVFGVHGAVENGVPSVAGTTGTQPLRLCLAANGACHSAEGGFATIHQPAFPQLQHSVSSIHPNCWDGPTSTRKAHPAAKAKFNLDVINSLCEQDGWKWTSGMLIAGCLHYALGNYAAAFDSFSRVIAADPR